MLNPRRKDYAAADRVRTPRFFQTDEGWFFRTREGISIGAYKTEFDAEISSSLLSARLAQLDDDSKAVATIHAFIHDPAYGPTNVHVPNNVPNKAAEPSKAPEAPEKSEDELERVRYRKMRAEMPKPEVDVQPLSMRLRSLLPGTSAVR